MIARALPVALALLAVACGGSEPSQALPGPTSASRLGLDGEILETISYEYLAGGRLTARESSQARIRFFYDRDDRLALVDFVSSAEERPQEQLVYNYDGMGRVAVLERQKVATGEVLQSTRYEYDAEISDRVVVREDELPRSITEPKRRFAYRYDAAGRLLEEKPMGEGSDVLYVYVDNGVLRHRDSGDLRRVYELDSYGNLLSEKLVYAWDETRVYEQWVYGYEGWADASDQEKDAPRTDTPYLSATVH